MLRISVDYNSFSLLIIVGHVRNCALGLGAIVLTTLSLFVLWIAAALCFVSVTDPVPHSQLRRIPFDAGEPRIRVSSKAHIGRHIARSTTVSADLYRSAAAWMESVLPEDLLLDTEEYPPGPLHTLVSVRPRGSHAAAFEAEPATAAAAEKGGAAAQQQPPPDPSIPRVAWSSLHYSEETGNLSFTLINQRTKRRRPSFTVQRYTATVAPMLDPSLDPNLAGASGCGSGGSVGRQEESAAATASDDSTGIPVDVAGTEDWSETERHTVAGTLELVTESAASHATAVFYSVVRNATRHIHMLVHPWPLPAAAASSQGRSPPPPVEWDRVEGRVGPGGADFVLRGSLAVSAAEWVSGGACLSVGRREDTAVFRTLCFDDSEEHEGRAVAAEAPQHRFDGVEEAEAGEPAADAADTEGEGSEGHEGSEGPAETAEGVQRPTEAEDGDAGDDDDAFPSPLVPVVLHDLGGGRIFSAAVDSDPGTTWRRAAAAAAAASARQNAAAATAASSAAEEDESSRDRFRLGYLYTLVFGGSDTDGENDTVGSNDTADNASGSTESDASEAAPEATVEEAPALLPPSVPPSHGGLHVGVFFGGGDVYAPLDVLPGHALAEHASIGGVAAVVDTLRSRHIKASSPDGRHVALTLLDDTLVVYDIVGLLQARDDVYALTTDDLANYKTVVPNVALQGVVFLKVVPQAIRRILSEHWSGGDDGRGGTDVSRRFQKPRFSSTGNYLTVVTRHSVQVYRQELRGSSVWVLLRRTALLGSLLNWLHGGPAPPLATGVQWALGWRLNRESSEVGLGQLSDSLESTVVERDGQAFLVLLYERGVVLAYTLQEGVPPAVNVMAAFVNLCLTVLATAVSYFFKTESTIASMMVILTPIAFLLFFEAFATDSVVIDEDYAAYVGEQAYGGYARGYTSPLADLMQLVTVATPVPSTATLLEAGRACIPLLAALDRMQRSSEEEAAAAAADDAAQYADDSELSFAAKVELTLRTRHLADARRTTGVLRSSGGGGGGRSGGGSGISGFFTLVFLPFLVVSAPFVALVLKGDGEEGTEN